MGLVYSFGVFADALGHFQVSHLRRRNRQGKRPLALVADPPCNHRRGRHAALIGPPLSGGSCRVLPRVVQRSREKPGTRPASDGWTVRPQTPCSPRYNESRRCAQPSDGPNPARRRRSISRLATITALPGLQETSVEFRSAPDRTEPTRWGFVISILVFPMERKASGLTSRPCLESPSRG